MPDDDACTDAEIEAYNAFMTKVAAVFSGARSDMAFRAIETLAVYILRNVQEEHQPRMFVTLMQRIGDRLAHGDDDDDDQIIAVEGLH